MRDFFLRNIIRVTLWIYIYIFPMPNPWGGPYTDIYGVWDKIPWFYGCRMSYNMFWDTKQSYFDQSSYWEYSLGLLDYPHSVYIRIYSIQESSPAWRNMKITMFICQKTYIFIYEGGYCKTCICEALTGFHYATSNEYIIMISES